MSEDKKADLEWAIHFWEVKLQDKYLMSPATIVLIEHTVGFLKELKKIKDSAPLTIP